MVFRIVTAGPHGLPAGLPEWLSVYEPERAELAPGDVVRITRNDAALDLANGDRFKIEKVEAGRVTIDNGKRRVELPAGKPLHLDHAYATTVHSAQGLTADRVLVDFHAESRTTANDVYYVAISRARHEARIFTNDLAKLPAAIARENVKSAALDLARERSGKQNGRTGTRDHEQEPRRGGEREPRTGGDLGKPNGGENHGWARDAGDRHDARRKADTGDRRQTAHAADSARHGHGKVDEREAER